MNTIKPKSNILLLILSTLLALSVLSIPQTALAKQTKNQEVNYLELASLMLKDGHLDRAKIALSQIDPENQEQELDLQRYYIISALLSIRTNNNIDAINWIKQAKEQGKVDAVIDIYLAQAAYATENYQLAIDALDSAGAAVAKIPSIYHMRAQSHWYLKNHQMAIAILDQASEIFSLDKSFPRRKIFYYLELGYNKQAALLGKHYLEKFTGERSDYVAIGNALRASGDKISALQFLEIARLKFPTDENIAKSLAAIYIHAENYFSAAKIIHDAAYINPKLIKDAAELYRRAGSQYMALSLNGMIQDQTEKLKQRMALMLQLENFEQAAAMENNIKRVHLDSDENMKYALAYSLFKIGHYAKAENYLAQITDAEIFKKALKLRKIMADCAPDAWRCQ
ncbi:MAG: hypothetical protein JKY19_15745 [Alcanivoracaceae bacterium]|nr:hypothetical protein [Alcanivoracaceae bacterium]